MTSQTKQKFDNIIDAKIDYTNNMIEFSPTKKCKFKLFGYNYQNTTENYDANLSSHIKDWDSVDVNMYFEYSLIDIANENQSTSEIHSKYILQVYTTTEYNDNVFDIELFRYKLTVKDFKYSVKYNKMFAVVESTLLTNLNDFEIHYNDINGKEIYNNDGNLKYVSFTIEEFNKSFKEETVFPPDVYYISVHYQYVDKIYSVIHDLKLCTININIPKLEPEPIYSIGIVGDFEYDHYHTEFRNIYNNAIKVFKENKCDFICGTGNLVKETSLNTLNEVINDIIIPANLNFVSPKGPYDNAILLGRSTAIQNVWNNNICANFLNDEEVFKCPYDSSSFYFLKEVKVDKNNKFNDCFIFLSVDYDSNQTYMQYRLSSNEEYDYRAYNPRTLGWLLHVLETNKYHRIFLFTNLYFSQKAGNYNGNESLYKASDGTINMSISTKLCGSQFRILNEINNRYKNCIIFTGNSRYSFEWQSKDTNIIICNKDYVINRIYDKDLSQSEPVCNSGYNVHVPTLYNVMPIKRNINSNSTPEPYATSYNEGQTIMSEAMVMKVYHKYIEIIGYKLQNYHQDGVIDTFTNSIYPYSYYRLNISAN